MSIVKVYEKGQCKLKIEAKTRRVLYRYVVNSDITCEFDLLSHVSDPYVDIFKDIIFENDLEIETYDNAADSYCYGYYDRLKEGQ